MARLYYNKAIVATYMCIEFGVKFKGFKGDSEIAWSYYGDYYTGKYYIHPDSEHIFEPQEGDLMMCLGSMGDPDIAMFVMDKTDIGICTEIIQRNNKQFFMPERGD